jgi:CBS domain-containing protein
LDFARAFSRSGGGQSDAAAAPDALLSMRIRDLMTADPITIAPDSPVRDAARIIRDRDVSCLPVVRDDRLIGILTTGDLADRVIAEGLPAETLVGDVMTPDPMTVDTAALGYDALVAMTERRITHLPVVEAGRLVGVLTGTNLRLLTLAEAKLGPAPVPYLWLACGSQGRQEQTGVSDQDNCLILDDAATPADDAYFAELAKFVSDGLTRRGISTAPAT